jgi:hypothetical protein
VKTKYDGFASKFYVTANDMGHGDFSLEIPLKDARRSEVLVTKTLTADAPKLLAALVKIVEAEEAQDQATHTGQGMAATRKNLAAAIADAKKLIGGEG